MARHSFNDRHPIPFIMWVSLLILLSHCCLELAGSCLQPGHCQMDKHTHTPHANLLHPPLSLPHFTSYMLPIYEVANPRTCIGLPLHPAGYLTHPERRVHGQNNCPGGNMSHANLHLLPLPLLPPTPTKECHIWPSSHFGTLTITLRNQREPMPFWPWLLGWTPP
jgi:hypothetical protein